MVIKKFQNIFESTISNIIVRRTLCLYCICIQITVIGDECLRKFECRYATEKLLDRLVFWSGPCLLLFAVWSDQRGLCCSMRRLRHG